MTPDRRTAAFYPWLSLALRRGRTYTEPTPFRYMWTPRYSLRAIKLAWVALIIWSEVGVFIAASTRCHWPDSPVGEANATHILLVADPQILNERSYPERGSLLRAASQIFVDVNLRKAWRVAKSTRPHTVIFLGDMLDNGFADMPAIKYRKYVDRFRSIFSSSPTLPVYYLPGNHDVGLGDGQDRSEYARSRYAAAFGPFSQHIELGGHSLVMVDAPALADEDWRENAGENRTTSLPRDLMHIQQTHAGQDDMPLILFSHIPLYRPPRSNCGPLRERGSIPAVRGEGYQTLLSPATSNLLLTSFHPTLIFSGDDHDYCEYAHTFLDCSIPEVTVKSLSLAMGIRQPGFQLLSLFKEARASAYRPCALPDQLRAYCWVYAPFLLVSILLVAVRAALTPPSRYQRLGARRSFGELPAYYAPSKPVRISSRGPSYGLRVAEDVWAVAWPPLAVYVTIAASTVFW